MKIVTAAEMREIDRITSERFGVPSLALMENAGEAVAAGALFALGFRSPRRFGVICGKGNNGGDGFVAARKLHAAGKEVKVLLLGDPSELRGDAAEMFAKLPVKAVIARSSDDLGKDDARAVFDTEVLIDAILGTGFRPPVTGFYADAIGIINATSARVLAVDVPSGADADSIGEQTGPMARADGIVTFTAPRPAHIFGGLTTGSIVIAPIGSPEDAVHSTRQLNLITPGDIAPLIGKRPRDAHKGSFGHVLVLGGSLGKAGSAAMCGMAALKVGAGLATVATPKSVLPTVAGFYPELMTEAIEETEVGSISMRALAYGHIDAVVRGKTVLAIGPGLSQHKETVAFVRAVVRKFDTPLVLDADGLNAFDGCSGELNGKGRALVITPHPGEMARLLGSTSVNVQRDRINIARTFAREHDLIVVLKGNRTLVANSDGEVWVNTTGNPGMATGGTGDILTGMIAGMVAQNSEKIFEAVMAAVYLHGLAGDSAAYSRDRMVEQTLVASDLLDSMAGAFRAARRGHATAKSPLKGVLIQG